MTSLSLRKKLAYLCLCLSILAATAAGVLLWLRPDSVLEQVRKRGYLRCGVNGSLPYFSERQSAVDEDGYYLVASGFDADFCRVVAVAVFGTYTNTLKFKDLTAGNRFAALRKGEIDVLIRNTTWTAGRDTGEGVDFTAITLYTGQKFLVRRDAALTSLADLAGQPICVQPGSASARTSTYLNLVDLVVGFYTADELAEPVIVTEKGPGEPFVNNDETFKAFLAGECKAITSGVDQLEAYFAPQPERRAEYRLIPEEPIANEPRGPVVVANDSQWRDVVSYAAWATIYADELGLTAQTVGAYLQNPSVRYKKFLGIADPQIPPDQYIGNKLELAPTFARHIIEQIGNYSAIYERHLLTIMPERGANQISQRFDEQQHVWRPLDNAGQLFSPPFE